MRFALNFDTALRDRHRNHIILFLLRTTHGSFGVVSEKKFVVSGRTTTRVSGRFSRYFGK